MAKIHLMKKELANLIAAGEVIERPASVVKELVENSIDAGSKNIFISFSYKGGRSSILVKDDGSGMDREDAKMCFLRHASSKIKSEYDLARIKTLGFRGEAIPSIASVAKITLVTSTGDEEGTKVISEPGEELVISDAMSRKGTTFQVDDLFFNTPARLKYLKSEKSETYALVELVEHLALAFPEISFQLVVDEKEIFKTSNHGDLLETVQKIYGNSLALSLYSFKKEGVAYSFSGFTSKPEVSYSKKYNISIFLNNRFIYSYKLSKAIEEAYKDFLPPLRYPFTILKIDTDPSLVDVNVHPTKKEVRISLENEIALDVKREIESLLRLKKPIYEASDDSRSSSILVNDMKVADSLKTEVVTKKEESKEENRLFVPISYESRIAPSTTSFKKVEEDEKEFSDKPFTGKLEAMHPVGQILDTYIICSCEDGFYLIDQHAAAERINFEKAEFQFKNITSTSVPLFPIILDLSFKEQQNLDDKHINALKEMYIIIEAFGEKTIKVIEIPTFLNVNEQKDIISDIIHTTLNDEKCNPIDLLRHTIADIACKRSIKANRLLSTYEMEKLIADLARCENPANCPHGRPTMIKIKKNDIEKMFRRTGF